MMPGAGSEGRRALLLSTLAFAACFAVWTIFSIIGIRIKDELGLNETEFGLLIGTPILTGSLTRLFLGIWADRYGGRIVFPLVMVAAAAAAFLVPSATTFPQMLLAALGVGMAGGSFAVGVAYVSRWYPAERQGTALGIFGVGNIGTAITLFAAPLVLVPFGWQAVPRVWGTILLAVAALFWLFAREDPIVRERRAGGRPARSLRQQFAPLGRLQVWRFSLYYFFFFGAFVGLSLWLPRYLIGVYGLDISMAGMAAVLFSLPAAAFRAYGGHLADKYGARRVMYWTFSVAIACTFILSYPPTDYVVHGIRGPISFHFEIGLFGFAALMVILGYFMSLGMAAVYKHIPVYYPDNVGAVGGLVGMIGGLGGFVLPIAFGALNDLTGVWTSSFAFLFLLVTTAYIWMRVAVQRMERGVTAPGLLKLPELPEMQALHQPKHVGVLGAHLIADWRAEDPEFWRTTGRAIARRNLWISIPSLLLSFAIWMVWSVVVAKLPAVGFAYTTDELFWLAALPGLSGATLRIFYSFMVPIFGGRLWTTLATWSLMIPAVGIGYAVQNPSTPYALFLVLALLCGFGGGNFASSMSNISFFFPRSEKGNALALNAGLGNLGVSVVQFVVPIVITAGVFGWFGGDPRRATVDGVDADLAAERGFIWIPLIAAAAFAAWFGMNDIASMKASFTEQAVIFRRRHNWIMCAVHRHLRFLHRLLGRLPAAGQEPIPGCRRLATGIPWPAGRRPGPFGQRLAGRQARRRAGDVLELRCDDRRGSWSPPLPRHQGPDRGLRGVLCKLRPAVLRDGCRQRLDLPDDPGDHAQGDGTAGARPGRGRTENSRRQGIGRDHWIHVGRRRLWRIFHPQELRHLDRPHGRRGNGAVGFRRILRELPRRHLVRLHAPRRSASRD